MFVEALITTPLAFLIVSASLYSMDPALEESARVAGSSNLAGGLADYFSDCSARAAGVGDAQLCSGHRKF